MVATVVQGIGSGITLMFGVTLSLFTYVTMSFGSGTNPLLECVWDLLIYVFLFAVNVLGGRVLWQCMNVVAGLGVSLLLLFAIATLSYSEISFATFASLNFNATSGAAADFPIGSNWFANGASGFFQCVPLGIFWFLGVETSALAAEEIHDPAHSLPVGAIRGQLLCLVLSIPTLFCAVSMPPGLPTLSQTFFVLNSGFQLGFGLNDEQGVYTTVLSMIGAHCAGSLHVPDQLMN